MRDELPKYPRHIECGVINLDVSSGPGTHWVAYYKNGELIEYFDSFGNLQPPKEVISYLGSRIMYNYYQHQKYNSVVCGHLCLKFLYQCYLNKYFK